nr:N-acetyl-gamma-glutamyl-phosphate reductase [Thermoanaerobacterales bacterium]
MISRVPTVGIIGASGFTGAELLRLCAAHPALDVRVATGDSQAGRRVADLYPSLAAAYGDLPLEKYDADRCDGLDLVFLALPHGASQQVVPELLGRVGAIVDLAADFRLRDPAAY